MKADFRNEIAARNVLAEGHEVSLVVASADGLVGVEQNRWLVDRPWPFGMTDEDLAAEEQWAGRILKRSQAVLGWPLPGLSEGRIGE